MTFYNSCVKNNYDPEYVLNFHNDLLITHLSYDLLINKFKNKKNVIFIADPPYLSTDNDAYTSYWGLHEFLDVFTNLRGTNYIFFTSDKSHLIELDEWLNINVGKGFFNEDKVIYQKEMRNKNYSFLDLMVVNIKGYKNKLEESR